MIRDNVSPMRWSTLPFRSPRSTTTWKLSLWPRSPRASSETIRAAGDTGVEVARQPFRRHLNFGSARWPWPRGTARAGSLGLFRKVLVRVDVLRTFSVRRADGTTLHLVDGDNDSTPGDAENVFVEGCALPLEPAPEPLSQLPAGLARGGRRHGPVGTATPPDVADRPVRSPQTVGAPPLQIMARRAAAVCRHRAVAACPRRSWTAIRPARRAAAGCRHRSASPTTAARSDS